MTMGTHKIYLCSQLSKKEDRLQVSACDGIQPFAMAPRDIPTESFPCGAVGSTSNPVFKSPPQIEQCFFEGYRQCQTEAMGYKTLLDGQQVERAFYIDQPAVLPTSAGHIRQLAPAWSGVLMGFNSGSVVRMATCSFPATCHHRLLEHHSSLRGFCQRSFQASRSHHAGMISSSRSKCKPFARPLNAVSWPNLP